MAETTTFQASKRPRQLSEEEDFTSFQLWKKSVTFYLSHGPYAHFKRFFKDETTWTTSAADTVKRGLVVETKEDAAKIKADLEECLDQLTQYAPHLIAQEIVEDSTSFNWVWQRIRRYYNLQNSEISFLRIMNMRLEPNERPERFYQRLLAHVRDHLLNPDTNNLRYKNNIVSEKEKMSPTIERLVTAIWLDRLDPNLTDQVVKAFSHDLTGSTCPDIQPRICLSLPSLLQSARQDPSAQISFTSNRMNQRPQPRGRGISPMQRNPPYQTTATNANRSTPPQASTCLLCSTARRPSNHSMADCIYISLADKQAIARKTASTVRMHQVLVEDNFPNLEITDDEQIMFPAMDDQNPSDI